MSGCPESDIKVSGKPLTPPADGSNRLIKYGANDKKTVLMADAWLGSRCDTYQDQ
jgi:hypothetical protein